MIATAPPPRPVSCFCGMHELEVAIVTKAFSLRGDLTVVPLVFFHAVSGVYLVSSVIDRTFASQNVEWQPILKRC